VAKRMIVNIDEDKCTGCGLCAPGCAEGALQIIDGKARLIKEIYCDGLGACLGECPEGAITIEEREAEVFDEAAVHEHLKTFTPAPPATSGCPGSAVRQFAASDAPAGAPSGGCPGARVREFSSSAAEEESSAGVCVASAARSRLGHWPVQISLLPPVGPLWENADVLIAADCVPFAMADFHERLLAGKTVAIGCPKLDDVSAYTEKLTGIFSENPIRSVTVAHMEVPCCGGIAMAARQALEQSGRTDVLFHDVLVGIRGDVLSET
jgi:NAD-dependent dihydropyrimidine dehydrogenase PreA subunit